MHDLEFYSYSVEESVKEYQKSLILSTNTKWLKSLSNVRNSGQSILIHAFIFNFKYTFILKLGNVL